MLENFGSYIKHERELRGVTLEAISGTTKIHIRFLRALEDNNFEELPGEVFIRGYIRSYADTIGSDPEETLNVYEEFVGNKVSLNNLDSVYQSNTSVIRFLGYALTGLLILVLVFGVKILLSNQYKLGEQKTNHSLSLPEKVLEKETAQQIKNNLDKKQAIKESIDLVKEEETVKPEAEVQQQEISLSSTEEEDIGTLEKPLKLTIKAKIDSWFNITIDSFRDEDFILPAGEEKSFLGNKTFRLTIGNNKGTELILNGKHLVIPEGEQNIVKDFIINAKLID